MLTFFLCNNQTPVAEQRCVAQRHAMTEVDPHLTEPPVADSQPSAATAEVPETTDTQAPCSATEQLPEPEVPVAAAPAPKKKAGRPAGSKNKPKVVRVPVTAPVPEQSGASQQARSEAALQQQLASEVIAAIAPIAAAPQINLTDTLRETLRKLHIERKQKQATLYANLALSGLR